MTAKAAPARRHSALLNRNLRLEGWRASCQSYAVIAQWLLLAFARRSELALSFRALPYASSDWQSLERLFGPEAEAALAAIPAAAEGDVADATLRIYFPYDCRPAPRGRTVVFGTSEFQAVPPSHFAPPVDFAALAREAAFTFVTSSRWSAEGFRRAGLAAERLAIVPLGVDVATFRPNPGERAAFRTRNGLDGFVFMSVGAMAPTKGIDTLLEAFAAVAEVRPDARLFLKGSDSLYRSADMLRGHLAGLSTAQRHLVEARLRYSGAPLSMRLMAEIYQVADVYVSPYRGEGFNLPVLEAAACGVPVICTGGGATDEFTTPDFARRIASRIGSGEFEGMPARYLAPERDDLVALMLQAIDDGAWRAAAAVAGPRHVAAGFTWDHSAARLLELLF